MTKTLHPRARGQSALIRTIIVSYFFGNSREVERMRTTNYLYDLSRKEVKAASFDTQRLLLLFAA
jgi:outer membrane lipoprotein-sorting protein